MHTRAFVFGLLLLSTPCSLAAQEWDEFTSLQDGFRLNFPGKPTVTETKWTSQLNYVLPARVYSTVKDKERYSVTVVDYRASSSKASSEPSRARRGTRTAARTRPRRWARDMRDTTNVERSSMRRSRCCNVTPS